MFFSLGTRLHDVEIGAEHLETVWMHIDLLIGNYIEKLNGISDSSYAVAFQSALNDSTEYWKECGEYSSRLYDVLDEALQKIGQDLQEH